MRVVDLKALMKERGLRGYSKLRKAELIALLQNNSPALCNRPTPGPQTRPPRPTSSPPPPLIDDRPSVRFRSDRPRQPELLRQLGKRQPSSREMDVFEQQEMSKNRPQVTSKLNDWRDWLVNHVPKTIKDKASRAFKTFKDKIMGLFKGDNEREDQTLPSSNLGLDLGSARVQTTTWIRFKRALEDDFGFDRVELPFNSRMTEIFQGSDLNEIVNEMFAHMVMQIRNPALRNSRFVFNEVLFLDVKASYI